MILNSKSELGYSSYITVKDIYTLTDEDYVDWYSEDTHEEIDISSCLSSERYAEYKGKKVKLNKPFKTPGESKKFAVYVKNKNGRVIIVRFGDPSMGHYKEGKKKGSGHDDAGRRANFKSRHNCDTATDKTTPRYWSCHWSW